MATLVTKDLITNYSESALREAHEAKQEARESRKGSSWAPAAVGSVFSGRAPLVNYTDNSWNWGSRNVTTTHHGSSSRGEKKDDGVSVVAVIFGLLFGVVGLAATGRLYKRLTKVSESYHMRESIRKAMTSEQWSNDISQSVRSDFQKLVSVQSEIDRMKYNKVSNYFYSALGLGVGGALLGAGALSMAPWMITAGQITLFASVLLAAVTAGLHWDDEAELAELYGKVEVLAGRMHAVLNPWTSPTAWLPSPNVGDNKARALSAAPRRA